MEEVSGLVPLRPLELASSSCVDTNPSRGVIAAGTIAPARPSTLRASVSTLDRNLRAREMHKAATQAGYHTTMAAIYSARTSLGLAKPRYRHERKSRPQPAPPEPQAFVPPSDEAILKHLILKMGLERAYQVFADVERLATELDL